jgi:hypothetical protein
LDSLISGQGQGAKVEPARGAVRCELSKGSASSGRLGSPSVDDEQYVPRTKQQPGNSPSPCARGSRNPRPQRRVVQRDLTPAPAGVRDTDPAERRHDVPALLREHEEAELERSSCK